MDMLQVVWYLVIGISMVLYCVLDGFDLGVGMLHLFAKKDTDRRIFLNAIGPVWDGNEVWLVIVVGALFAGFPPVYASLLSGFYNLVMLFLAGLIFRAVAIEFRSKQPSLKWRAAWDKVFCIASFAIAFSLGVVLGNLVEGVPLDAAGNFQADLSLIFRPYAVLIGILSISLFMMHGAIYLTMKTEDALHERLRRWVNRSIVCFFLVYAATTVATVHSMEHMVMPLLMRPWMFVFPAFGFVSLFFVPYFFKKGKDLTAFGLSCLGILLLVLIYGIGTFPTIVRSTIDPEHFSITIANSASSSLTLKVLLVIVAIGIPPVLAYGTCIYRIFRGKVTLNNTSY